MQSERPLKVVFFRTRSREDTAQKVFGECMKKNPHEGSDFRDLLREEGLLEEVELGALKKALAIQFEKIRQERALTKSEMAAQMRTSRAAVDRLLDGSNPSVSLVTLSKAAKVLGRKLKIELAPA
jgi:antitoxin HicB